MYTFNKTPKIDEQWSLKANKYFWPNSFTNKFVKHGNEYESTTRNLYARYTNQKILECGLITNSNNQWLGYTSDGIIVNCENEPIKLIEIKCPYKGKSSCISDVISNLKCIIRHSDDSLSLKKSHSYYLNNQLLLLQLVVLNYYWSRIFNRSVM